MQGDILLTSEPIAYRTPVYPWFLAFGRLLAGEHALWLITLMQGLLYVCTVYLAANLALKMTKLPQSKLFTALAMLPAISLYYTTAILSETLFVFLLVLHLSIFLKYCTAAKHAYRYMDCVEFRALSADQTDRADALGCPCTASAYLLVDQIAAETGSANSILQMVTLCGSTLALTILLTPWFARNHVLFGRRH